MKKKSVKNSQLNLFNLKVPDEMKIIKNTGLAIVTAAFLLFIATLFFNDYKITDKTIENQGLSEVQLQSFQKASQSIKGKTFVSKFQFLDALDEAFDNANAIIIKEYKITDDDIQKIVKIAEQNGAINYSTSSADSIYSKNDPNTVAKIKGIKDYTGWMEGREFLST